MATHFIIVKNPMASIQRSVSLAWIPMISSRSRSSTVSHSPWASSPLISRMISFCESMNCMDQTQLSVCLTLTDLIGLSSGKSKELLTWKHFPNCIEGGFDGGPELSEILKLTIAPISCIAHSTFMILRLFRDTSLLCYKVFNWGHSV